MYFYIVTMLACIIVGSMSYVLSRFQQRNRSQQEQLETLKLNNKQLTEQNTETEQHWRNSLEFATGLYAHLNKRLMFTHASQNFDHQLSIPPSLLQGEKIWLLFTAEQRQQLEPQVKRATESQTAVSFDAHMESHFGTRTYSLTLTPELNDDNNIIGYFLHGIDQTDSRALAIQTERAFTRSPGIVIVCRPDGTVIRLNEQAQNMFNTYNMTPFGHNLSTVFKTPDANNLVKDFIKNTLDKKQAEQALTLEPAPNTFLYLQCSASYIPENQEVYIYAQDVTQHHTALTSQRSFLKEMNHDIRTPLNGVVGMVKLLEDTELNEQQQQYVKQAVQSSENLLDHVEDILELNLLESDELKLEPKVFETTALFDLLINKIANTYSNQGIEVACYADSNIPPTLYGDDKRIANAAKHLIKAAAPDLATITNGFVMEAQYEQNTLQLRFVYTGDLNNYQHLGQEKLDMKMAHQLIQQLGAKLSTSAKANQVTLQLCLPLAAACSVDENATNMNSQDLSTALSGRNILAVDDHDFNRHIFLRMLQRAGATVTTAYNAKKARHMLEQQNKYNFDAVIMDNLMPDQNGPELFTSLKEAGINLPPTILASSAALANEQEYIDMGFSAVLRKPVLADKLYATLLSNMAQKDIPTKVESKAPQPKFNVLVAEDNTTNQLFMEALLKKLNHNFTIVGNGIEAVKAIQNNSFNIVLMDIQMPDMDGITATKHIRNLNEPKGRTPIIAVTAHAMQGDREKYMAEDMNDYISKPIDQKELVKLLEKYCGTAQPTETESKAAKAV